MGEEGFLRRWARRKTESQLGHEPAPEPQQEVPAAAPAAPPDAAPVAAGGRFTRAGPGTVAGTSMATDAGTGMRADARADARASTHAVAHTITPDCAPLPAPTMADVALLTPDSDYSGFVARGVDQAVRRTALKKLFADPHFNLMDRLDVYIDDYNKPSPVSPDMLASLRHAQSVFGRLTDEEETVVAGDALASSAGTAAAPSGELSAGVDEAAPVDGAAHAGQDQPAVQSDAPADVQADGQADPQPVPADAIASTGPGAADSVAHPIPYQRYAQQYSPETETP